MKDDKFFTKRRVGKIALYTVIYTIVYVAIHDVFDSRMNKGKS